MEKPYTIVEGLAAAAGRNRGAIAVEVCLVLVSLAYLGMLGTFLNSVNNGAPSSESDLTFAIAVMSFGNGAVWRYLAAGVGLILSSTLPIGMAAFRLKLDYGDGANVIGGIVLIALMLCVNMLLANAIVTTLAMPILWAALLVTLSAVAACCISS